MTTTAEQVRPAKAAIEDAIAADIISQIKTVGENVRVSVFTLSNVSVAKMNTKH